MALWQSCDEKHVGYPKHFADVGPFILTVSFYDGVWLMACKGAMLSEVLEAADEQDAKRQAEDRLARILCGALNLLLEDR